MVKKKQVSKPKTIEGTIFSDRRGERYRVTTYGAVPLGGYYVGGTAGYSIRALRGLLNNSPFVFIRKCDGAFSRWKCEPIR